MLKIIISISKSAILDEVSLNSEYAGVKTPGETGLYDRVATVEADSLLLSRFWTEMCGEITDRLHDFITSSSISEDLFSLNLELSNAYDPSLTQSVIDDLRGATAAGVTGRWFRFTFPDRADAWTEKAASHLAKAYAKLCHRRKPVRKGEDRV